MNLRKWLGFTRKQYKTANGKVLLVWNKKYLKYDVFYHGSMLNTIEEEQFIKHILLNM